MVKKKKTKEEKAEVDFGIGKLGFGGLFRGIANLIDLVARMEEEGKTEIRREGEIKGLGEKLGRKDVRGVYGFTLRTLKPEQGKTFLKDRARSSFGRSGLRVEPFGNIKETKKGPQIVETREPITDIFDEKNHVLVVAELPGVDEKNISAEIKGDILLLEANEGRKRKYFKEILLPSLVDEKSKETSFKNGILEVKFKKLTKK